MQERDLSVRQTRISRYEPVEYNGKNESGIWPISDRVLVAPDKAISKSKGGVIIADSTQEKHTLASESGTIIAVGPGAFAWTADRLRQFEGRKPQPGDRVVFERYTGLEEIGLDGQFYRVMSDSAIGAIRSTKEPK